MKKRYILIISILSLFLFVLLTYRLNNKLLKPTYSDSCPVVGDVNQDGIANRDDAILIAKYVINNDENKEISLCADVNQDSLIKMNDAMRILLGDFSLETTGIVLSAPSRAVDIDSSIKVTATIKPGDALNKKVTWTSSNPDVATVDDDGNVTGIKNGMAKIMASTKNGVSDTYNVMVNQLVNITPSSTIEVDTANDAPWHTAKGMCTVEVNNKLYYLAAVIQMGTSDKDKQNTRMYILDDSHQIKAVVGDYSFGYANSMTSDSEYIYIYDSQTTLFRIKLENYVNDAIERYNSTGTMITEDFTANGNYVEKFTISKGYTNSIYYDKNSGQLYGTNTEALYKINLNSDNKTASTDLVAYYPEGNISATNAGLAIWGDYVLKGALYNYNAVHPYYENIIDIYKLNYDKTSLTYVTSSKFSNTGGDIGKYEIKDLDIIDDDKLVLHYNRNSKKVNHIYLINLNELWDQNIIANRLNYTSNTKNGTSLSWTRGYIDNNGNLVDNSSTGTYTSDYFSVTNYSMLEISLANASSITTAYFDSNKHFISKTSVSKNVVPTNAAYARVTVIKSSLGNNGYDGTGTTISLYKKSLRILFIGNSLTQDGIAYLPYMLKTYYPEIDFKIYMWYIGGYKLNQQYDTFVNDGTAEIFSVAENSASWTNNKNNTTMKSILSSYQFDIVSIQEYFSKFNTYTDLTSLNNIINYVNSNYSGGNKLEFISLFPAAHRTINNYNEDNIFETTNSANVLMLQTGVIDDMISNGIAIHRALSTELDALGDTQHLSPDNLHAQEGLPCLLQTYVTLCWIFDRMDIQKTILGSPMRMTTDIYNTINVPGANLGSGVITGTEAQNEEAQKVAINAYKEGRQLVVQNFYR